MNRFFFAPRRAAIGNRRRTLQSCSDSELCWLRDRFAAAEAYARDHKVYVELSPRERAKVMAPRVDLELEALAEVLASRRLIHCHSYRQDEIFMLCGLANEYGIKIGTFQHVLEGYKVADAIKQSAIGASSFSDWWAYKFEVYDAIPYNGALMTEVGVTVSFNSDSSELARRMNTEAAKAVRYGGMEPQEALKLVCLNPAKQLRVDNRIGSLEAGKDAVAVAQEMLKKHFKVIYNGNGYDPAWPAEADKLGITHIDSGVEAIDKFVAEKNVKMFEDLKVFDAAECAARRTILLDLYVGTIEMEVGCMIDMINQHAIPSAKAAGIDAAGMSAGVVKLEAALKEMHAAADEYEAAKLARVLRLDTMIDVRKVVDDVEAICPADKWTLATYKELLFVDVGKFA